MFGPFAVLVLILGLPSLIAADDWFDCVLPWDDGSPTLTSWASLNGLPGRPLERISVEGDRFVDAQGSRVKFLGTNMSLLPPDGTGPSVAGRLAKFGVNIVRFHHLDASWNENLFHASWGERTIELDEGFLARYDRFRADLAAKGIYSNVNLLTGRLFTSADGLPSSIDSIADWKVRHSVGFWYRPLLQLQKDFARRLLTHRSQASGLTLAVDPSVAFVEINNENGLVQTWLNGDLDGLAPDLLAPLKNQWNLWVARQFSTRDSFVVAMGVAPSGPAVTVVNEISHPLSRWNLEQHEAAKARSGPGPGPGNSPALRVEVLQPGAEGWHVQLNQPGLRLEAGQTYLLRFKARAQGARKVDAALMMAHAPWESLGASARFDLTPDWKTCETYIAVTKTDANARINLGDLGRTTGWVEFSEVSLSAGGRELGKGEDPTKGTLNLLPRSGGGFPRGYIDLWTRFLAETERVYWEEMRDYLVKVLGVRAVVVPTILGCTTPEILSSFPSVDAHAYWNHPSFPGTPWDLNNWFVTNSPLVKARDGGTIGSLSLYRVEGKPFTVSEYDHPFPNTFAAEGNPILGSYAAFQGWDAIYSFAYDATDSTGKPSRKITSFFDQANNPAKMAGLLLAAGAFRRGDVDEAREAVLAGRNVAVELARLSVASSWGMGSAAALGLDPRMSLVHRTGQVSGEVGSPWPSLPSPPYKSDTGQLTWDAEQGLVIVDSARTKIVTGFFAGKLVSLSEGVVLASRGPARATTLGMTLKAGESFTAKNARILVTALGSVRNSGQDTRVYGGVRTDTPGEGVALTTRADLGPGPVQMQGVNASVGLPFLGRTVRAWVLDLRGARLRTLPVTERDGTAWIELSAAEKALWYELEAE